MFEKQFEGKRERRGQRVIDILSFHPSMLLSVSSFPKWPQQLGMGQTEASSQELYPNFHMDDRNSSTWASIPLFPSRELGLKQRCPVLNQHSTSSQATLNQYSNIGCGHPNQWLNLLCHNACFPPRKIFICADI